jgi:hypothetical protein
VPLIKRMRFVALRDWAYSTLHASPDLFDRTKMATVMARIAASSKKAPPSIKPTEPPTFSAERKDWPKWRGPQRPIFPLSPPRILTRCCSMSYAQSQCPRRIHSQSTAASSPTAQATTAPLTEI